MSFSLTVREDSCPCSVVIGYDGGSSSVVGDAQAMAISKAMPIFALRLDSDDESAEGSSTKVMIAKEWIGQDGEITWFSVLGKLFSKRTPHLEGFRAAMFQAWKPNMGMRVREVGEKSFLFEFEDGVDRDRVLVTQPWKFQRSLLLLTEFDGLDQPEDIVFDVSPIWVRVFGLPPGYMTDMIGLAIGESLGRVQDVDMDDGRYIRLRVDLDIYKPLQKGTTVTTPEGEEKENKFRYKKTPDLCFVCGFLTHQEPDCPMAFEQIRRHRFSVKKYTTDIKAETPIVTPRGGGRLTSQTFSVGSGSNSNAFSLIRRSIMECGGYRRGDQAFLPQTSATRRLEPLFRDHVDSRDIRGKQVAHGREEVERSCEIISRFPEKQLEQRTTRLEDGEVSSRRVEVEERGIRSLNGGVVGNRGPVVGDVEGQSLAHGKNVVNTVGVGLNVGGVENWAENTSLGVEGYSPTIPGIGSGVAIEGVGLMSGQGTLPLGHPGAVSSFPATGTSQGDIRAILANLAASPSFVFSAGVETSKEQPRKWKKLARVASKYESDGRCQNPSFQPGVKRRVPGGCEMEVDDTSMAKRSRELEEGVAESVGASVAVEDTGRELEADKHLPAAETASEAKTKCSSSEMDWIRSRLGFDSCFSVPCIGRVGGLALLWMNIDVVSLLSYSHSHIDVIIGSDSLSWHFTGFYGRPETSHRHESWRLLRTLNRQSDLPWLCAGDFNEIRSLDEKKGGSIRPISQMEDFNSVIDDCGFQELPVQGPLLSWSRRQNGEMVFERLDRCLVTEAWWQRFGYSVEKHLITRASDHLPLLILISDKPIIDITVPPFRFENMWSSHPLFASVVTQSWQASNAANINIKIARCGRDLELWNRRVFGNIRFNLTRKKREYEELYSKGDLVDLCQFERCKDELDQLYKQEEVLWRQRSKALWLKEGDRNTRYFHSVASIRKQRRTITGIRDGQGTWFTEPAAVEKVITAYYEDIFSSTKPTVESINKVLEPMDQRLNEDMRSILDVDFTPAEIKAAAFQMEGEKAPGPDGMTPRFFQSCWSTVGEDVISMSLAFLNEGKPLPDINDTNIVLIPKINSPEFVKDFRPISLCNVIFKIISKALTNRLKKILPMIIGENQSAFVPERMIFDNVMIAFEMIHFLRNKRHGRKSHMALKLDLSKAYDRVEWDFLEACMRKMGFSDMWISRVMICVRSVTYSINVNGKQCVKFSPQRDADTQGIIQGVSVARSTPRVSHLFFADDSILFLRASRGDSDGILGILKDFEVASGQQINIDKSSVLFSANTPPLVRVSIMSHLGVQRILERDKYLGLPIMIGKSKSREFLYIKDRLQQCVQRWNNRLFSIAGKAIMIQSIAQAIPVYLMSVFRFPRSFIHELNMVIANFWWGMKDRRKRIHWKSWESLCVSKADGGLGFRDFEAFNLSLPSKQCWRLINNPSSLCFRVLRAKYFSSGQFLNTRLGSNPSFLWRSLLAGRDVLVEGSRWRIGLGDLDVWRDRWLNNSPSYLPTPREGVAQAPMKVADLIDFEARQWDEDKLLNLFEDEDIVRIMCLPIPKALTRDCLIWNDSELGSFSVRSAYYVARQILGRADGTRTDRVPIWNRLWHLLVMPKRKYFVWRVAWNILPIKPVLIQRGLQIEDICDVCGGRETSLLHIFFDCLFSKQVWSFSCPWVEQSVADWDGESDFWFYFLSKSSRLGQLDRVVNTLWLIWQNRNKCLYSSTCRLPRSVDIAAINLSKQFQLATACDSHRSSISHGSKTWTAPPVGVIKLNVDASFSVETNEAGLGVVARDSGGAVLVSAARRLLFVSSPLYAEVHALLFAFEVALEYGYNSCILESDSLIAITGINSSKPCWWEEGELIYEIRELALLFDECCFIHVNREANVLAHRLASLRIDFVRCGSLPPDVCNSNLSN
ncbi:reverse transcriptase [Corchorus capsularis]|uniref:Reverse transcriptase n=1 Tax=Corchorus capsularis TaxID=210143 RepID=A0A1R3HKR2_COCAP|nr:reverse transcriptase [Corchorus capsularis]